MKKIVTVFLFSTLLTKISCAQEIYRQYTYWLRYQAQVTLSPSLQWNTELDNRRFFDPDVALQFITHTRLHYRTQQWIFGGGLTYSVAFAQFPEEGFDEGLSEIRPVIEASHELPVGKIYLYNRFRIDDRFLQANQDESVFHESVNILRFRYRLQARIPVKKEEGIEKIMLRVSDEIMFNNWKNTFDQNRIYATLEFYLSKKFSLESGYIHIYQQRFGRESYFDRHVLRFSLLHHIALR